MRCAGILVALLVACGAPTTTIRATGFKSGWYVLQFPGAVVEARRPDGSPWHQTQADGTSVVIGGLLGLAIGNPSLGITMGKSVATPGGDPLAPAPFVVVKLGGETYKTAAVQRSYSPTWQQPIVVDARHLGGAEQAVIQVMDAIDGALIAQLELPLAELVSRPARTFTALGSVASLDLNVKPYVPRKPAEYQLVVPSNVRLETLLERGAPDWQPIPVWNGDTVTIEATGRVCPATLSSDCFGPDGDNQGRWIGDNYDGFKKMPHASLVAALPGANHAVGAKRILRAEQSGRMLLFVNDRDVGNNKGTYRVRVHVAPPE